MISMDPISEALALRGAIVEWRRDFHMYPELGYEEERTSRIVEEHLRRWGYKVKRVGTGIVAEMGRGKKGIALRADMDALPIQEENDVPYRSKVPGKMHACGHDAHTAMLLGAAEIIARHEEELKGRVRLIFQPAEEGGNGALKMVEAGAVDEVDAILGIHVWADLPSGLVGVREGALLAGSGEFELLITGKGGHGAYPHETVDPIPPAAEVISAFQTVVSRNLNPLKAGVLSVTSVHGGSAFNVIPESVELKGTFRFFDEEVGELIKERMKEIVDGIAKAYGVSHSLRIRDLTPPTINNPNLARFVVRIARKCRINCVDVPPSMGAEDFAYYLQRVPGVFIVLGTRNEGKGIVYPHHHPKFDVDEDVLHVGTAIEVAVAFEFLSRDGLP